MNVCIDSHISDDLFEKYVLRRVSGPEAISLEGHLLVCSLCQIRLAGLEEYVAIMRAALLELQTDTITPIRTKSAVAL